MCEPGAMLHSVPGLEPDITSGRSPAFEASHQTPFAPSPSVPAAAPRRARPLPPTAMRGVQAALGWLASGAAAPGSPSSESTISIGLLARARKRSRAGNVPSSAIRTLWGRGGGVHARLHANARAWAGAPCVCARARVCVCV